MNKLIKKFKESNKGFTLVELIVVIAVLAVITVVAAPQYLKYVEKARIGTDENALGEIAHIAEIEYVGLKAAANAGAGDDVDDVDRSVVVTVKDGKFALDETAGELDKAVAEVMGSYKVVSDTYASASVEINLVDGVAKWNPIR